MVTRIQKHCDGGLSVYAMADIVPTLHVLNSYLGKINKDDMLTPDGYLYEAGTMMCISIKGHPVGHTYEIEFVFEPEENPELYHHIDFKGFDIDRLMSMTVKETQERFAVAWADFREAVYEALGLPRLIKKLNNFFLRG